MKRLLKISVLGVFGIFAAAMFLNSSSSLTTSAQPRTTPTPRAAAGLPTPAPKSTPPTPAATPKPSAAPTPAAGGKTIQAHFTLGLDSLSEHGAAEFNHETHAFKNYSVDGKSPVACIECHHTDQPKSALKPPLLTSERDQILTLAVYQASNQKVSKCRDCHFQDGNVPEGKTMPVDAKGKDLNNEIAYHVNCNTCHDQAAKLRPEVKKTAGFATTNDCFVCHKQN